MSDIFRDHRVETIILKSGLDQDLSTHLNMLKGNPFIQIES